MFCYSVLFVPKSLPLMFSFDHTSWGTTCCTCCTCCNRSSSLSPHGGASPSIGALQRAHAPLPTWWTGKALPHSFLSFLQVKIDRLSPGFDERNLQRRCGSRERERGYRWRRETKWIVLLQIQFLIAAGMLGGRREKKTVKERGEGECRYHV